MMLKITKNLKLKRLDSMEGFMSVKEVETYEHQIMQLRHKLDELDQMIVNTLRTRFEITDQIGEIKRTFEMPIYDSNREQEILAKLKAMFSLESNDSTFENITEVYRTIMEQSRKRQGQP